MSKRIVEQRRLKKYSTGDFNDQLRLHIRSLTSPNFGTAEFTEEYNTGMLSWCIVITFEIGKKVFDGVNLENQPTHLFVVRHRDWITSEIVIQWSDDYYKIIKAHDPEERHEYYELYSKLLGDKELQANQ
ncbi:MAG: head-tail adaptor protein [Bacteroidetes bacterium]|nr:head-tail adaptor protein [Bacteroidota bacterium]